MTSHELPSSIKALEALEQQIKEDDIRCIFTEPTTPLKLAEIMADHTGVDLQMVDIEWAPEPLPGADATFLREPYVQLMQQLADKMTQCFALKEGKTLAARR